MNGEGHRIMESPLGVGCEINGDRRSRSGGPGYCDVQHDLAIQAMRQGRAVVAMIHGDTFDLRRLQSEHLEVLPDIGCTVASTQFDQANGLSFSIRFRREVVELSHLRRSVGEVRDTATETISSTTVPNVRLSNRP